MKELKAETEPPIFGEKRKKPKSNYNLFNFIFMKTYNIEINTGVVLPVMVDEKNIFAVGKVVVENSFDLSDYLGNVIRFEEWVRESFPEIQIKYTTIKEKNGSVGVHYLHIISEGNVGRITLKRSQNFMKNADLQIMGIEEYAKKESKLEKILNGWAEISSRQVIFKIKSQTVKESFMWDELEYLENKSFSLPVEGEKELKIIWEKIKKQGKINVENINKIFSSVELAFPG